MKAGTSDGGGATLWEQIFQRRNLFAALARVEANGGAPGVGRVVTDRRVKRLIHLYLISGVMVEGVVMASEEGTPQGGPLSPLLSNIMLDDLDKELERRGHRFVCYADDCNIYVQSARAGERVMKSVKHFGDDDLGQRLADADLLREARAFFR
jgi:retron-type reverse transcriptase